MCNWTEESILELRKDRDAMEERVKTLEVALEKMGKRVDGLYSWSKKVSEVWNSTRVRVHYH